MLASCRLLVLVCFVFRECCFNDFDLVEDIVVDDLKLLFYVCSGVVEV